MKKIILLLIAALMTVGCEQQEEKPKYKRYYTGNCNVVVIDSCEYIVNVEKYAFSHSDEVYETYTHKGNCRFCEERDSIKWEKRRKELEELIIKLKEQ